MERAGLAPKNRHVQLLDHMHPQRGADLYSLVSVEQYDGGSSAAGMHYRNQHKGNYLYDNLLDFKENNQISVFTEKGREVSALSKNWRNSTLQMRMVFLLSDRMAAR